MDEDSWELIVPNISGELTPIDFRQQLRGGYSSVYKSFWEGDLVIIIRNSRSLTNLSPLQVAVKVLRPVGTLKSMKRKVMREGFIWSQLNHPNILPLLGFANDDPGFQPFGAFVSPWCPNGNSEEYLAVRGDFMSLEERLSLLCEVTEGANYLHQQNPPIIHGDIKPANILIDRHGVPKLCDFGLARILSAEGETGLTTTSAYTGTERYLAPELVDGDDYIVPTCESDVYAMGCVGLKFLFLQNPYGHRLNNSHGRIVLDIYRGIPPATFPANMPPESQTAITILQHSWNRKPSSRPDMSRFLALLQQIQRPVGNAAQYVEPEYPAFLNNIALSIEDISLESLLPPSDIYFMSQTVHLSTWYRILIRRKWTVWAHDPARQRKVVEILSEWYGYRLAPSKEELMSFYRELHSMEGESIGYECEWPKSKCKLLLPSSTKPQDNIQEDVLCHLGIKLHTCSDW
ncbi:kinase-like protein [Serendipita vermifera]|nr:kinase-like protein [Serendipita vermifera]